MSEPATSDDELDDDLRNLPNSSALSEALFFAMGSRAVALGLLGAVVAAYGAAAIHSLVGLPPEVWRPEPGGTAGAGFLDWTGLRRSLPADGSIQAHLAAAADPYLAVVRPFVHALSPSPGMFDRVRALLLGLWTLFVWIGFGGAIARVVLAPFARRRKLGAAAALGRGLSRSGVASRALTAPLLTAAVLCLPGILVGLLSRIPWIGPGIAWFLGFVPFLAALGAVYLLFDTAVGFPMFVVVASADEDSFETVSAGFSYAHTRRAGYIGMYAVGAAGGAAALFVMRNVFGAVAGLAGTTYLAGAGSAATAPVAYSTFADLMTIGFAHGFFWCWSTMVYLVLRRNIDGVPIWTADVPKEEAAPDSESDPEEAPAAIEG